MTKKILIHVMNPVGFIAGVSAVKTLHQKGFVAYIVVEWPGSILLSQEITEIIQKFSKEFSFIKKVIPKSVALRKKQFDEIYFSHDLNEGSLEPLFKKFPQAKRICYGDSFGLVYTKESFFRLLKISKKENYFKKIKQLFDKYRYSLNIAAQQAVLILPVDQSGVYFKNVPLLVCSKNMVLDILKKTLVSCQDLQRYILEMLKLADDKKMFLFLTENFAEANLIKIDREIEMYVAIIKKYCQRKDIIFLKSHPGEALERNKKIIAKLENYQIYEIDQKYKRYPIELWQGLLKRSVVISVAYPVLSLKYLYNIDIIQPMDNSLIRKWFSQDKQAYLKDSIGQYMKPLKNLKSWHGKGPLYVQKND